MSDNVELSQLSIKALRELAGEHQINNRSRMGRDVLIQKLRAVLARAAGVTNDAAAPVQQEISAVTAPVASEAEPEVLDAAAVASHLEAPMVAAQANAPVVSAAQTAPVASAAAPQMHTSEPEVLDAAAVAGLVSTPDVATSETVTTAGETLTADGQPASEGPGEGERRRRRRRRRRGRGRNRDGQPHADGSPSQAQHEYEGDADGDDEGDDSDDVAAPLADAATPAPTPAPAPKLQPAPAATTAPAVAQPRNDAPREARNDQQPRQDAPRQDQRPQDGQPRQPHDQRPPRPRIDGPLRSMPSVLDRLCTFTRGILELCDPSTPSWAQARLSELLAEAGLVPVPCQGTPHPDFHQVVGTVVAKDVPAGLIARVEAPGFALRGDRGDLFPQRKAQVRISGDKDELVAPTALAPRVDTRPAPVRSEPAPTAAAPVAADAAPQPRRDDRPRNDRPRDERPRRDERQPTPAAPIATTGDEATPLAADASAPSEAQTRRDEHQRNDRPRDERRPARQPEQGRDPHRTHGREFPSEAPALPLAQQDPAELAQRPKAEGFRALGLNDQILADLAAMGWNEPSPIQTQAVPVASTGRDIIGQAQTGTGKTGAFVLPLLQRLYAINDQERRPAALVLCPTRELAKQVHHEFTRMAGTSGARACLIYGGTSMDEQFQALERHPHVVIGTPGRIIDHVKRRTLDLSRLSAVILDEADQMLDIGFWPDVQYVISHTPPARQIMLFSATFPDPIRQMAEQHMKNPEHVRIAPKVVTVDQVDQKFIAVPHDKKTSLLAHFIDTQNPDSMIVFCRTKHQTDRVAEVLKRKNYSAGAIHGDLPQTKRERILSQFRSSELKCLIATNVAARGLDIPIVSHVVNYDIPEMPEEYVHRIGRTARNGAPGVARTFITPEDGQFLLEIEKHIGLLLEEERVDGFTPVIAPAEQVRTIAETPVGTPRLLKPLVGGLRLGRRRR